MIQKILKYIILALFIVNLPTVALNNFGGSFGSILSYGSFVLLIIYYVFFLVGGRPNFWMLYMGLAYFTISGLHIYFSTEQSSWIIALIKYSILIIFGNSFFKEVTKKEMIFFLFIGALSVIANGFFIPSEYGRASGFYFNANPAGMACLFGYTLTYSIKNKTLRTFLQLLFTLGGFVTFSRTFIVVWIVINLISIKKSRKNIRIFALGIGAFVTLFIMGELLNLGGERFETFKATISNEGPNNRIEEGSRTSTWSRFYDAVLDSPFIGNGYGSFKGDGIHKTGVHNTYLLIIGESGIIPFLVFVFLIIKTIKLGWNYFKEDETLLYMSITLALYFLTLHDFFEYYFMLAIVLFWLNQIELAKKNTITKVV